MYCEWPFTMRQGPCPNRATSKFWTRSFFNPGIAGYKKLCPGHLEIAIPDTKMYFFRNIPLYAVEPIEPEKVA